MSIKNTFESVECSSQYRPDDTDWSPDQANKGWNSWGNTEFFHSEEETNPWLRFIFGERLRVVSVTVYHRFNAWQDR